MYAHLSWNFSWANRRIIRGTINLVENSDDHLIEHSDEHLYQHSADHQNRQSFGHSY